MSAIMMMSLAQSQNVTVTPSTPGTMRALLSPSGQTAYDAASNNNWFNVSSADYAAVLAGLTNTSAIGMSDAQVTGSASSFVGTYGATLPAANSTVPAGNYIIGFVTRGATATAATFRPYVSTTFKGVYSTLGGNTITTAATASPVYYLIKNPSSTQASTSYVALGPRNAGGGNWAAAGPTWPAGGGYSSNMTSWTNFTGVLPIQQWLITTTQP